MPESPPIQRIFLDLGHVLFYLNVENIWKHLKAHTRLSQSEFFETFYQSGLQIQYETGQISTKNFFEHTTVLLKLQCDQDTLKTAWHSMLAPHTENIAFAQELAQQYPIGVISNTNDFHAHQVESTTTLSKFTDHRIYSHEVGYLKPRKEIYEAALQQTRNDPTQCVFIDDRQDNVEGAIACGIHAYLIKPSSSLKTLWETTILPKHPCTKIS